MGYVNATGGEGGGETNPGDNDGGAGGNGGNISLEDVLIVGSITAAGGPAGPGGPSDGVPGVISWFSGSGGVVGPIDPNSENIPVFTELAQFGNSGGRRILGSGILAANVTLLDGLVTGPDVGGTYAIPVVNQARGLRETFGPTTLAMDAVADGQVLQRIGSTISGGGSASAAMHLFNYANLR